jgi:hypothetical protein
VAAYTTVDRVSYRGLVRHFNTRPPRRLDEWAQIRPLIDELVSQELVAERWVAKAGVEGRTLDFRVVVIAGKAQQVLPRLGRGPITNLHLRNARGDLAAVADRLGADAIDLVRDVAERAAACWPASLYMGVDVLLTPSGRVFVAEVNGFGDWHEGVTIGGKDTYALELEALERVAA